MGRASRNAMLLREMMLLLLGGHNYDDGNDSSPNAAVPGTG